MKFASLKYDFVFKEVFSNETVRKYFIGDVTGIPLDHIKTVRIDNPFLRKKFRRQKQGVLDLAVILNDNTRIDIELQIRNQKYWTERNLFYLAKMYTDDMRMGENYSRLRKCITISILDFQLIESEEYHTVYSLRDKKGKEFTNLFEVHIIELNKALKETDVIDGWIRLFNAESLEDLDMIKTKNAGILEAMEVMRTMSLGRWLRWMYEERLKATRDRWAEDEYVRDLGKAEGKAESILAALGMYASVPSDMREIIMKQTDFEILNLWFASAVKSKNLEEWKSLVGWKE